MWGLSGFAAEFPHLHSRPIWSQIRIAAAAGQPEPRFSQADQLCPLATTRAQARQILTRPWLSLAWILATSWLHLRYILAATWAYPGHLLARTR